MTRTNNYALVVDTSAVIAILTKEPGHERLIHHLQEAREKLMSAATFVETGIVLESRIGPSGKLVLDEFAAEIKLEIVPLDREMAETALAGWRHYGKGRRHPAQLNYGDCFTYALAHQRQIPVLCTGKDFSATPLTCLT